MTTMTVHDILVRKSIVVEAPREHVFRTFTERIDTWWPRSHHIGDREAFTAILEPRPGGRWLERADDGSECQWGHVIDWQPPERVLLAWELDHEWKYKAGLATEVEVRFIAEAPARTRVELEHRKLHRYGDKAEMMRVIFEGDNAWAQMLKAMKEGAERR
jgi:uncharacterized protein YndB with AHSA1/START domain